MLSDFREKGPSLLTAATPPSPGCHLCIRTTAKACRDEGSASSRDGSCSGQRVPAWQNVCIAMVRLHYGKATSWLCWKWHQSSLPKTASTAPTSRNVFSPFHLQECRSLLLHPLLSMLCPLAQSHSSWRKTPDKTRLHSSVLLPISI